MSHILKVNMLGNFSLSCGENLIDESNNRKRKVWLLLAYLIYSRNNRLSQDNYLSVIRGSEIEDVDDPAGRLKALFYRARAMLDELYDNAGHELIVRKNGTYGWNDEAEICLDVEEFDSLCQRAHESDDKELKTELMKKAVALYKGDFLAKLSTESWVMPLNAYYHQKYLTVAETLLSMLEELEAYGEMEEISRTALTIEPYSENLYCFLMKSKLALGDRNGVISVFEEMSELLFATFGVMPSDESREIYRKASEYSSDKEVPIGTVKENLVEKEDKGGAMYCEFDFFRFLYQVYARSVSRTGDIIHIALFSLHSKTKKAISRKSLDKAMENFKEIVMSGLRRGDVISTCSISQLVIMLPGADSENSNMVCQRLAKSFYRKYPHSPADIRFNVQLLEPKDQLLK